MVAVGSAFAADNYRFAATPDGTVRSACYGHRVPSAGHALLREGLDRGPLVAALGRSGAERRSGTATRRCAPPVAQRALDRRKRRARARFPARPGAAQRGPDARPRPSVVQRLGETLAEPHAGLRSRSAPLRSSTSTRPAGAQRASGARSGALSPSRQRSSGSPPAVIRATSSGCSARSSRASPALGSLAGLRLSRSRTAPALLGAPRQGLHRPQRGVGFVYSIALQIGRIGAWPSF